MTMRPSCRDRSAPDRRSSDASGFGLVEALVAIVVFTVGMLTVAGVALQVGQLTTRSAVGTHQTMAADQHFDLLREEDFDDVTAGTTTLEVGNHSYTVAREVTPLSTDTKEVVAVVSGGPFAPDTFRTVLHRATGYPSSP
ncbi:MAG: type IV pilus modification PilV family protein [Acidobacteriota bacterium]